MDLKINPLQDIDMSVLKLKSHTNLSIRRYINRALLDLLASHNVYLHHAESFFRDPFHTQPIHIDTAPGDYAKLNYVYSTGSSVMNWYCVKPNVKINTKITTIGTKYVGLDLSEVQLIESHAIGFPSLVQVGIPHNVVNGSAERLCVSLVLADKSGFKLTMAESIRRLNTYIC